MKVLVTGANRGIGLAFCQHYIAQGYQVFAVCRQTSEALSALGCVIIDDVDVTEPASLQRVVDALSMVELDLVINNAGIFLNEKLDNMDFAAIEKQFEVNALAPLKLIFLLQDKIVSGGKIAMITSRMGSISDNGSGEYYGYRMSKAALNAASKSLAVDLRAKEIAVAILHPGYVATRMVGFSGDVDPTQSVSGLTERIEALDLNNSGTFWHANGEVLPW